MAELDVPFSRIQETLKRTVSALDEAEIPFLIGGSLASWARGGPNTTHDLDVMDHIAASPVERLYAETEQRIHTDHEDILNALLKFESGVLGVLQVNWLTPTKIRELTVLGERGM